MCHHCGPILLIKIVDEGVLHVIFEVVFDDFFFFFLLFPDACIDVIQTFSGYIEYRI